MAEKKRREDMSPWERGYRPIYVTGDVRKELEEGQRLHGCVTLQDYLLKLHRERKAGQ